MADLSSKEWRDLIFEGKNKEFGAYEMRKTSTARHNKAFFIVIAVVLVCVALLVLQLNGLLGSSEEEDKLAPVEQTDFSLAVDLEEIEEEEVQQQEPEPEPEPEQVIEEEVQQQVFTESVIKDEVKEELKLNREQVKEDDRNMGSKDVQQGKEEFTSEKESQKDVVVEKIKETVIAAPPPPVEKPEPKPEPKPVETKVFTAVEQMPSFPGGDAALAKFLASNLTYPQQAAEEGIEGKVYVKFVVGPDGSISQAQIARGKHPALDKEALRVVKKLPKFTPGRQNGQAVSVWYTLPVNFKLQQQ